MSMFFSDFIEKENMLYNYDKQSQFSNAFHSTTFLIYILALSALFVVMYIPDTHENLKNVFFFGNAALAFMYHFGILFCLLVAGKKDFCDSIAEMYLEATLHSPTVFQILVRPINFIFLTVIGLLFYYDYKLFFALNFVAFILVNFLFITCIADVKKFMNNRLIELKNESDKEAQEQKNEQNKKAQKKVKKTKPEESESNNVATTDTQEEPS
jgi:hypothetical protein